MSLLLVMLGLLVLGDLFALGDAMIRGKRYAPPPRGTADWSADRLPSVPYRGIFP